MKTLFVIFIALALSFTACNFGNQDIHQARERELELQLTRLDQRVSMLEDSLAMCRASDSASGQAALPKNRVAQSKNDETADPTEPSLYKNIVYHHVHTSQSTSTPGLFPESSDRLLFIKDVISLSDWGLQVMLNEIYARHGMIFSNAKLSNHFNKQHWYHGTTANVNNKMTTTEIRNVEFIKTYKYTPDTQNNN